MDGFPLSLLLSRRKRMKNYIRVRTELEGLSDADLCDIGIKRYQIGHLARVQGLKL
jgi:uncharacterized protein YjiS (DUF1127 family)